MRRPAVFFDRDNTLIVGSEYLGDPEQVVLVAGAPAAVAKCRAMGFAVIVVSNQSGVARGMFGEDEVRAVNKRMDEMLLSANPAAVIERHEYCPFHPEAKSERYKQDSFLRKPKPGMILAAADALALDLARSWVVGDAPRDIAAGKAAGCRTVLVVDPSLVPSPAALEQGPTKPDFVVSTLIEAVEIIARQTNKVPPPTMDAGGESRERPSAPATTPPRSPRAEAAFAASRSVEPVTESPRMPDAPVAQRPAETPPSTVDTTRMELLLQQVLVELRKLNDVRTEDFSISKLVAGIMQVLAVAAVLLAYFLYRSDAPNLQAWLLAATFLQTFTIALLIMSRQK